VSVAPIRGGARPLRQFQAGLGETERGAFRLVRGFGLAGRVSGGAGAASFSESLRRETAGKQVPAVRALLEQGSHIRLAS